MTDQLNTGKYLAEIDVEKLANRRSCRLTLSTQARGKIRSAPDHDWFFSPLEDTTGAFCLVLLHPGLRSCTPWRCFYIMTTSQILPLSTLQMVRLELFLRSKGHPGRI